MTTIVYRQGILACDRQVAMGSYTRPTDMKLHKVKSSYSIEYALAFSGSIIMGLAFVEWVKGGRVRGKFPIQDINKERAFHCLLVTRHVNEASVEYFGNDLVGMPEDEALYIAQGSGDEFAYGAMYQGATAIEAVQAANHMCAWSSYGVVYIDVAGDYEIKTIEEG